MAEKCVWVLGLVAQTKSAALDAHSPPRHTYIELHLLHLATVENTKLDTWLTAFCHTKELSH